jgi:hypothetical protein
MLPTYPRHAMSAEEECLEFQLVIQPKKDRKPQASDSQSAGREFESS